MVAARQRRFIARANARLVVYYYYYYDICAVALKNRYFFFLSRKKGMIGSDGRYYVLDLVHTTPVDVNFPFPALCTPPPSLGGDATDVSAATDAPAAAAAAAAAPAAPPSISSGHT